MGKEKEFAIDGKTVRLLMGKDLESPVIYLHTFSDEADDIWKELEKIGSSGFSLVSVSGLDWNSDMSPWPASPIFRNSNPFLGKANEYIRFLTDEIIPESEKEMRNIPWRGIAGYSLAGLFALYTLYRTNLFSRVASISSSLWYPEVYEYMTSCKMQRKPDCIYFSLGNKEKRSKNPYLRNVEANTLKIRNYCESLGIDTCFTLNEGNHYEDSEKRIALGLSWISGWDDSFGERGIRTLGSK